MPLFRICIETEFILEAADEKEANSEAGAYVIDVLRDNSGEVVSWVERLNPKSQLAKEWDDCYPYGGEGELTVGQLLAAEEAVKSDENQLPIASVMKKD